MLRRAFAAFAALVVVACGSSSPATAPSPGPPASGADPIFTTANVWTQAVDGAAIHPQSTAMISQLVSLGGFGLGRFQVDFSMVVLDAAVGVAQAPFVPSPGYYTPDCDTLASVPLPAGGAIEGQPGYSCDTSANDCHLIVVDRQAARLVEVYQATVDAGGRVHGLCGIAWNLSTSYPPDVRGDQCTSADAAGLPIAPLLFSADELAHGSIDHAIRFILPNARIRNGVYVHPATHSTSAASGGSGTPPYGARFRLRADYPLASLPSDGARAVAKGLQQYGMFLSDGGNIALTAQSDRLTTAKWDGLLDSYDLSGLQVSDFQMVDGGSRVTYTGDCSRQP
jgi:serine/threonine-protein kinase